MDKFETDVYIDDNVEIISDEKDLFIINDEYINDDFKDKLLNYILSKIKCKNTDKIVCNSKFLNIFNSFKEIDINQYKFVSDNPLIKYNIGKILNNEIYLDPLMDLNNDEIIFYKNNKIVYILELLDEHKIINY